MVMMTVTTSKMYNSSVPPNSALKQELLLTDRYYRYNYHVIDRDTPHKLITCLVINKETPTLAHPLQVPVKR